MNISFLLGLVLVVVAVVGLLVARTFKPRPRASRPHEPVRQETGKSRLTIISEVGVIIAIIGLLVR
jgi:heme/copper-type cytochrome/quinol oxidase subunit 2